MQISLLNSNNNINCSEQSFGKNVIGRVHLKKATGGDTFKFVKGYVSKLDEANPKDMALIGKIKNSWAGTDYGDEVIRTFQSGKKLFNIYMTEVKKSCGSIKENVCCLLETTNPKANPKNREHFFINYIQSAPEIANKKADSPIKGAGELAMYGAVKTAKKEKFKDVVVHSANEPFYEKIGFEKVPKTVYDSKGMKQISNYYKLSQDKYNEFLKNIEKKYHIGFFHC